MMLNIVSNMKQCKFMVEINGGFFELHNSLVLQDGTDNDEDYVEKMFITMH